MPFIEHLDLMHNALGSFSHRIPEVEGTLGRNGHRDATLLLCSTIDIH
jgi:hypothetical protein